MLTPIINVCHPLKTYGLCLTMKKWKPHFRRRRATSRVYQHTVSNITLCYTREQAVNTPLCHWRGQRVASGMLWLSKRAEHWLNSITLVKACYVCYICAINPVKSQCLCPLQPILSCGTKTSIATFPTDHLLLSLILSQGFLSSAAGVSLWLLRNEICKLRPQHLTSLQDFSSHTFHESLIQMS